MKPTIITLLSTLMFLVGFSACGKKQKDTLANQIQAYQKPEDATVRLEGQKFPYCVWYDPNKWLIINSPFDSCDDISEWTLILADLEKQVSIGKHLEKKAFAKTFTYEEKNLSKAKYKDFVQTKILGGDKENLLMFQDLGSEERLVNGIKIFAWKFKVKYQTIGSIITFLYFYTDNTGSVAVATHTPADEWKKNQKDMEEFLNGFCLLQSQ